MEEENYKLIPSYSVDHDGTDPEIVEYQDDSIYIVFLSRFLERVKKSRCVLGSIVTAGCVSAAPPSFVACLHCKYWCSYIFNRQNDAYLHWNLSISSFKIMQNLPASAHVL